MTKPSTRHYYKELRLQQFRSFCEAARHRSFAGAAAALGLSRPAVWQQIRALEKEFRSVLVRRRGRGLELTEDGQLLLDLVQPLVAGIESLPQLFEDRKGELPREVVVATTASLLANELKAPALEFRRRWPQVQLTLIDRPSIECIKLLENNQVDLAVANHLEEESRHPQLDYDPLFALPFFLVCPKDHALAQRRAPSLLELARYPMVLTAKGSRSRTRVERIFQEQGLLQQVRVVLETTNSHVIFEYVQIGLGITLTPLNTAIWSRTGLHIRSVANWFGEEPVLLMRRKGAHALPHVAGFRAVVLEMLTTSRA
jgi:DNA-binding transcriptional LysR family regulator